MLAPEELRAFEEAHRGLLGLAYRMLGTRADAEDAVPDAFLKWQQADRSAIANPAAWLTTVCTRHCMDLLKSHQRSRTDYVGQWLPEPVDDLAGEHEDSLVLAASLSTAFLLLLERLTPRERAAYLLHEIFAVLHFLRGRGEVLEFVRTFLHQVWKHYRWSEIEVNGGCGLRLMENGRTSAVLSFAYDDAGRATGIFIHRNPDKLTGLGGG